MSIRRINSTGRRRILRDDAQILLRTQSDGHLSFDASLDLIDYELPSDASVYIEAYRQTTFMRFDYGTVALPRPPTGNDRRLTEFSSKDGLLFRIKVTSVGERPGLLLAEGDGIPSREEQDEPDKRLPLLPAVPADLGQEIWKIDFAADGPHLLVNNQLDWVSVASTPMFRSLVFPSVIRQVLTQILIIDKDSDVEDLQNWRARWLKFAMALGAGEPPSTTSEEDEDEALEWIDGAAERFCATHSWLTHYVGELAQEGRGA